MAIRSRDYHEKHKAEWEASWAADLASGQVHFTVDYIFQGTVRHELGHCLTAQSHITALEATPYNLAWFSKNVSRYAATNTLEALAESFCSYTKPGYIKGTLPALIESIVDAMLNP